MRLTQLGGLLRYEALMYWRRRGLLVLLLAAVALPLALALNLTRQVLAAGSAAAVDPAELARAAVYLSWAPAFVAQMLLLPVLVADGLPRDQQLGVRELLDSLPLTAGTYLGGKLLGLWASLAGGVALGLAITGLAWRLAGAYDPWPYVQMWVVGVGGLVWLNGSLGFLLGAAQPDRRRAVLLGAALAAVMVFTLIPGQQAAPGSAAQIWNLARPAFLDDWLDGARSHQYVWQTLAVGAGQVAALALINWGWLRRRRG